MVAFIFLSFRKTLADVGGKQTDIKLYIDTYITVNGSKETPWTDLKNKLYDYSNLFFHYVPLSFSFSFFTMNVASMIAAYEISEPFKSQFLSVCLMLFSFGITSYTDWTVCLVYFLSLYSVELYLHLNNILNKVSLSRPKQQKGK